MGHAETIEQANAALRLGGRFVPPVGAHIRFLARGQLGHTAIVKTELVDTSMVSGGLEPRFRFGVWDNYYYADRWLPPETKFLIEELPEDCPPFEQWEGVEPWLAQARA